MAAYGKPEYWDERYTKDPEPFEWYQPYSALKDIIRTNGVQSDHRVLVIGCGNSALSEEMYRDGYKDITNVDISSVVIKAMTAKFSGPPFAGLVYKQMDCTDMSEFEDQAFDSIIDKGTVDSILCGDRSAENTQKMLNEISRVLKPTGTFICITYGQPTYRLSYLQNVELRWTVRVQTVQKPVNAVSSALACDESDAAHYIYICNKQAGDTATTTTEATA